MIKKNKFKLRKLPSYQISQGSKQSIFNNFLNNKNNLNDNLNNNITNNLNIMNTNLNKSQQLNYRKRYIK